MQSTQGNPVKSQIKLYFYTVQKKIYILNVARYTRGEITYPSRDTIFNI